LSRFFCLIAITMSIVLNAGLSRIISAAEVPRTVDEMFLYADMVVRCSILEVNSTARVPYNDLIPLSGRDDNPLMPVTILTVRIHSVLRGEPAGDEMEILAFGGTHAVDRDTRGPIVHYGAHTMDHEVGDELLVPLEYLAEVRGGMYLLLTDPGQFRNVNGAFQNKQVPPRIVTVDEIRLLLGEAALSRVLENATVGLEGTVLEIQREQLEGRYRRNEIAYVTMQTEDVFKGAPGDGTIEFRMITRGTDDPIRRVVPDMQVGEDWIVFLVRDDTGYFPAAGANGMFQIIDDRIVRNNRVELKGAEKKQLHAIIERPQE